MRTLMPWTRLTGTEMDRLLNHVLEGKLEAEPSAGAAWAPSMTSPKDSLIAKLEVVATFKNGLLIITLPKTPTSKGTTIPIKAE